jgi:alkyl hydroperoxide reductase subunit D
MSWIDKIKENIPEYAKDIKLNLDAVINRSSLGVEQSNGCALACAITLGNHYLVDIISESITDEIQKNSAMSAGIIMAQNNIWYPYVDMTSDANLKGLPAQLRMNVIGNHGGTTKELFEAYSLSASIIGKCHFCVQAHYNSLKSLGYTVEQLRDIGRIASTINALSKIKF